MAVTHAKMTDIELKPAGKGVPARLGTNISLEVGATPGGVGNQVIVRTWVPFDPDQSSLSDVQRSAAEHIHRVLQEASLSSQEQLEALLAKSVQHDPER